MRDTLFDIKALIESNKILRGKLKEAQKRIYELEGRIPPVMKCNVISHDFTKGIPKEANYVSVRGFRTGTLVDANQQRRPGNNTVAGIFVWVIIYVQTKNKVIKYKNIDYFCNCT